MKTALSLYVGLPVCLISEQGVLLAHGEISDITNSWRGLKVTVNEQTILLEPVRYQSTYHGANAAGIHLLPASEFEHWQKRGSAKLFDLLMLRFRYTHDRLNESVVHEIVTHLEAIEALLDQAKLTDEEKKRVQGLIRMHGDKATDRATLMQKTHLDFMAQYVFTAPKTGET